MAPFRSPSWSARVSRDLGPSFDALDLFERLRAGAPPDAPAWLLDSALPSARLGRYSFAGVDPYLVLRVRGERAELECRRAVHEGLVQGRRELSGDPFEIARALRPPAPRTEAALPFIGGAVGYLGYELANHVEPLGIGGLDDLRLPDLVLLFVDRLLAFDFVAGRAEVCALGFGECFEQARARAERAADETLASLRRGAAPRTRRREQRRRREPFAHFDAGTYAKAIDAIQEEIAQGNVYQACLTHRVERDWPGSAWELYRRLRRANPAPFASFFELPEVAIASSSPERFLRLTSAGEVESRPIKGTRPRGRHPAEDLANERALARSEKERAENLMIVDLVRNDLGRVCETGSVVVPELMAIEPYASVFQMVSTVRGRIRRGMDVFDALRATFPPGSMTGAPKIAAMRLLDRLEPVRRGVYSGAIGYLDVRGGADFSVTIRTLLLRGGRAYLHVGGGIVADSDPAAEYRETLDKARPLLAALGAEPV